MGRDELRHFCYCVHVQFVEIYVWICMLTDINPCIYICVVMKLYIMLYIAKKNAIVLAILYICMVSVK